MDKFLFAKFQDAGQKALAWTTRHKYATVMVLVLLGFLFWPKSTPKLSGGVEARKEQPMQVTAVTPTPAKPRATTQPATTQPVTAQRAADLPLYAPDQEGADPSWSLPAELKAGDLQRLAKQVDNLGREIPALGQLEAQCNEGISRLFDGQIVGLFWSRLMGKGFHDTKLPLDWYEVIKDRNSFAANFATVAEAFGNQMVQMTIMMRLAAVQVRIVGGHVLVGDMLFVKTAQQYIEQRRPYYERLWPLIQSVANRMGEEFRVEFNQNRQ
jgi:hypothetical protein